MDVCKFIADFVDITSKLNYKFYSLCEWNVISK